MAVSQIKGGAILSYISMILGNVLVLIYTPFMLKSLGSSEYGIYSICNTVSGSIAMLDAGFGVASVKYIVRDKTSEKLPNTLGSLMCVNFALAIIAFIITGSIASCSEYFFSNSMTAHELNSVKIILWLTGFYMVISFMVSIFPAIVVAYERFIFIKIVDICKSLLLPILIVPFLLCGYKAIAMSLITLIVFIGMNVAKIIYAFFKLKIRISFKQIDTKLIKEALPFASIIIAKLLLDRAYWGGGQLVLGAVSGTVAVTVFALALQISGYYSFIAQAVNNMFLPRCTELSKNNDIKGLSTLFIRVGRAQTYILGIILCVFVVFGKLFIELWAGGEYIDAYYCCIIMMIPYIIPLTQGIGNSILQAENKLKFQLIVYLLIVPGIIGLSYMLGIVYGALGCSVAICICIMIGEVILMNFYYNRIGLDVIDFWKNFMKIIFPMIFVSAITYCIMLLTKSSVWGYFFCGSAIFCLLLIIVSYFISMNTEEKELLNKMCNRILKR